MMEGAKVPSTSSLNHPLDRGVGWIKSGKSSESNGFRAPDVPRSFLKLISRCIPMDKSIDSDDSNPGEGAVTMVLLTLIESTMANGKGKRSQKGW